MNVTANSGELYARRVLGLDTLIHLKNLYRILI